MQSPDANVLVSAVGITDTSGDPEPCVEPPEGARRSGFVVEGGNIPDDRIKAGLTNRCGSEAVIAFSGTGKRELPSG
ncbi:MAG: hypothetical protein OXU19_00950 [bacterium]|nr:hypothetical protein [bacterium]